MVSTTGEHAAWFVLDEALRPVAAPMPDPVAAAVARIAENCEPALCTVLFMAGAGGSLRAGATENPVLLTRAVQRGRARVTAGGAPVYVWPGGGITFMVDVASLPANAFGYVPTPALVAPIEFTLPRADYERLGGYAGRVRRLADVLGRGAAARGDAAGGRALPGAAVTAQIALLPDGRLHLQHGPIDCVCRAWGDAEEVRAAYAQAAAAFPAILPGPLRRAAAPSHAAALVAARGRGRARHARAPRHPTPTSSSRRWRRSPAPLPTMCWRR